MAAAEEKGDGYAEAERRICRARATGADWLDLAGLSLRTMPDAIGNLSLLKSLYLYNNQLTVLPDAIGNLLQLETGFLDNNRLSALPTGLRALKKLERLYLHGNDALDIPPEVLGPTWEDVRQNNKSPAKPADILDYYFREKRPLLEAKLILVGLGGVGKTSLVKRLINGSFDPEERKTDGINITKWKIQIPDGRAKLNVWDFGGQEIMHATHQFFLTTRSLYLLVLAAREGRVDETAEYWLNLIKSFGQDSPVIVVLNKIDEHPFSLNENGLCARFPNIRAFAEIT